MVVNIRQEAGYIIVDYSESTANSYWDSHISLEFLGELLHFQQGSSLHAPLTGTIRFDKPSIDGTYNLTVRVWETAGSEIHGESINIYPITIESIQEPEPCISNWQCDPEMNGNMSDGCGNTVTNNECITSVNTPIETTNSNDSIIPIVLGAIGLGALLTIFSKK